MKCPKCGREVSTVYGNEQALGDEIPDSYKCEQCLDDDTARVVGCALLFVLFVFLPLVALALIHS